MASLLWNAASFVVAIGVLVSFHEFGHFWVARRMGVRVLRFSVGFGRPLWGRRGRDGVEYVISAMPLGGYVKMLDEREGPVPPVDAPRAFNRQPPWKRIVIVAAGPLFNFLLAFMLYWLVLVIGVSAPKPLIAEPPAGTVAARAGLHERDLIVRLDGKPVDTFDVLQSELVDRALDRRRVQLEIENPAGKTREVVLNLAGVRIEPDYLFKDLGLEPYEPPLAPVLDTVERGEAAAAAGFKPGDRLLDHDGVPIASWQEWTKWVRAHPGDVTRVRVLRGGAKITLTVIIGTQRQNGHEVGHFGAGMTLPPKLWQDLRAEHRLGFAPALPEAVAQTWQTSALTVRLLVHMVLGDVSVKNVSGPIQIAQYAGYSASLGLAFYLSFLAVVSVSLGVLNLLPVPVLDGGHLLYYVIEIAKGSPLSERAQALGQQVGLTLLILLMGLAFYNDIMRAFG